MSAALFGGALTPSEASKLEAWLGDGALAFTQIYRGVKGDPVADFKAAVGGVGPTFSIYDIRAEDRYSMRVGGYTQADWDGGPGYRADPTAFIFNLTTDEVQRVTARGSGGYDGTNYAIHSGSDSFAAFGNGHDLTGGFEVLGTNPGMYSYSATYDRAQGQITVAGDSGVGNGNSGIDYRHFTVQALEVYSVSIIVEDPPLDPSVVPLPAGFPLLLAGVGTFVLLRRRQQRARCG